MPKNFDLALASAFALGYAFAQGRKFKRPRGLAQDALKWITVHPNGKGVNASGGDIRGRPALIDGETGQVMGGMGGKFNGRKISETGGEGKRKFELSQTKIPARVSTEPAKQPEKPTEAKPKKVNWEQEFSRIDSENEAYFQAHPEAADFARELSMHADENRARAEAILKQAGQADLKYLQSRGSFKGIHHAIALVGVQGWKDAAKKKEAAKSKAAATRAKKLQAEFSAATKKTREAGIPADFSMIKDPIKVKKETDRAVQIEKGNGAKLWLPKSQVKTEGKFLTAISDWAKESKNLGDYTEGRSAKHEQNYQAYMQRKRDEERATEARHRQEAEEWAAKNAEERAEQRRRDREQAISEELAEVTKKYPNAQRKLFSEAQIRRGYAAESPFSSSYWQIVATSKYPDARTIDEDEPSFSAAHLLGEEGSKGRHAYAVLREK